MAFKVHPDALKELDSFGDETKKAIVAALAENVDDLPGRPDTDLPGLVQPVKLFPVPEVNSIVLYRMKDVDHDGIDDVVLLSFVRKDEVPTSYVPEKYAAPVFAAGLQDTVRSVLA